MVSRMLLRVEARPLASVPALAWPISFVSSLLLALGSPPDGWVGLIWLGFAPLTFVARRLDPAIAFRRAFAVGWVGGLCVGMVGFPWIGETLERFGEFPAWLAWLGLFAFSAWTAVPFGVWMWAVAVGPRRGPAGLLWPIALWVALARVWPAFFPYTVVIGIAETPPWMQAAELGGVGLVEAQVVAVGVLLADGLDRRGRGRFGRWIAAGLIPVVSWGLGAWRIASLQPPADAPMVRVGLVQPNVPLLARNPYEKILRLRTQSELAQREGAQLIVWPEAGAFPFMARRPVTRDFRDDGRKIMADHSVPTILGIATIGRGEKYEYNSAIVMDHQGNVLETFDKNILVPFGEYIPIVDPEWAQSIVPAMSHNYAGTGPVRFPVEAPSGPSFHAGPLICYEDIFPDFAHDVATQAGGIELFVNVTIDTWFGDTAEPWEHLALAQFRSVEHRIPMVRAVAAGTSSVVDHTGRLVAALPVRDPTPEDPIPAERLVYDVVLPRNTAEAPTIYALGGWTFGWLCVAASLSGGVASLVRRRRSGRAAERVDRVD